MVYERLYRSCLYGDTAENAKTFLHVYQMRMKDVVDNNQWSGYEAQEFHAWRTEWMIACLDRLPHWGHDGTTPMSEPERRARIDIATTRRHLDICYARRTHPIVL